MYKISFYVPEEAVEAVKNAMFTAGAGKLGDYEQVAWQTLGTGQFKPLSGSQPHIGAPNEMSYVQEYKVEMLCKPDILKTVIAALKEAHPYEEPAYEYIEINM